MSEFTEKLKNTIKLMEEDLKLLNKFSKYHKYQGRGRRRKVWMPINLLNELKKIEGAKE